MSTDNERVAGYIKQKVYDRFVEFCEQRQLTVSKGLNVILAEYFGIEEILDDRIYIGGVTLSEFQELKKKVEELSNILNELKNSSSKNEDKSDLLDDISSDKLNEKKDNRQLSRSALAKRLKVSPSTINRYQNKVKDKKMSKAEYIAWTRAKDPEGKGWWFKDSDNFLYDEQR